MQQTSLTQFKPKKQYFCFSCGVEIMYKKGEKVKNKYGREVPKRFNLNGTDHICDNSDKQNYQQSDQYQQNRSAWTDKKRRWWHGFGKKKYKYGYKEGYSKYNYNDRKNNRNYSDDWNRNYNKRQNYKKQYYNQFLDVSTAYEILGINRTEIEQKPKLERLRTAKQAYCKIALMYHPDRFNVKNPQATEDQKKEATEKFRKATEAWELLEDKLTQV